MKKFITTVKNIFSIEDLRIRILNTIGLLIVFRIGSFVVLPGVDPSRLGEAATGIFGLIDTFWVVLSVGLHIWLVIMPYISASTCPAIVDCWGTVFFKSSKRGRVWAKANQNQITRVLTILITIAQGIGFITANHS